jgi:hypothetical protein
MNMPTSPYLFRLCGLLVAVLGTSVPALADCNCPRMLYMTVNAGGQTYRYYMSTRFDNSGATCVPKTTTTMYSATTLDTTSTCCTGDCVAMPAGAPIVAPAPEAPPAEEPAAMAAPAVPAVLGRSTTPKNVDPIDPANLAKIYVGIMGSNKPCPAGTECWKKTGLKDVETFYFQLERVDGSVVWVYAMIHRAKFSITPPGGAAKHKTTYVANALQISGTPPAGADTLEDVFVGEQVGSDKHVYQVNVGAYDITTVTTAVP